MDTIPGGSTGGRNGDTLRDDDSGVEMLGKAASVFSALGPSPQTFAQLVSATHLARPAVHRLAVALEHRRLVTRDMQGRFTLGPRLGELASAASKGRLLASTNPVPIALRDHTGGPAQLFHRQGGQRVYVAAAERTVGLHDSIPIGAAPSMRARSATQVLLAWEELDRLHRGLYGANFTATNLSAVRERGWAQSVSERETGVTSISTPVRGPFGRAIAAISIPGPVEHMEHQPGRQHATAVVIAARRLTNVLQATGGLDAEL